MGGMIDLDDIHLEMNDAEYAQKYGYAYTTELTTETVIRVGEPTLFNISLIQENTGDVIAITMDTNMVEQLCANLNLFLLAEMMR